MNDRLQALRLFVRVARLGSLSRAGRELGVSQPSVSRILTGLERQVGVPLLTRTTRVVTLTEAGASYLARIEPLLLALDEADHAVRGDGVLRGSLRIGLSSSFGVREVVPRLPAFLERHPALRVDLAMSDHRQDLVTEGVDIALRLGVLADSAAPARRLGRVPRLVVAAPAYLARFGRPETPADLAGHSVIAGPGSAETWSFTRDDRRVSIQVEGRVTVTVNEGATAAAVAGLGIAAMSLWGCRTELASGALDRILDGWSLAPVDVHALFPAGRLPTPAARAFADYLGAALAAPGT